MNKYLAASSMLLAVLVCASALGQGHSDIEFGYANGKIDIELPPAGLIVFEGTFPDSGIFARRTSNPGFASERDPETMVGGIGPGDLIGYNVLDRLYYWSGTDFASPGSAFITIENALEPDTTVSGSSGVQLASLTSSPFTNVIGAAAGNGDFHSHVNFELGPSSAAFGAYGLVLSLSTDEPGIADSDRFGILFNYGLTEAQYESGVTAFNNLLNSSAVPEPSTYLLVTLGAVGLLFAGWRSRRASRGTSRFDTLEVRPNS